MLTAYIRSIHPDWDRTHIEREVSRRFLYGIPCRGSDKHLRDITGILKISGEDVDQECISKWAQRLNLTDIWEAILKRLGQKF